MGEGEPLRVGKRSEEEQSSSGPECGARVPTPQDRGVLVRNRRFAVMARLHFTPAGVGVPTGTRCAAAQRTRGYLPGRDSSSVSSRVIRSPRTPISVRRSFRRSAISA